MMMVMVREAAEATAAADVDDNVVENTTVSYTLFCLKQAFDMVTLHSLWPMAGITSTTLVCLMYQRCIGSRNIWTKGNLRSYTYLHVERNHGGRK